MQNHIITSNYNIIQYIINTLLTPINQIKSESLKKIMHNLWPIRILCQSHKNVVDVVDKMGAAVDLLNGRHKRNLQISLQSLVMIKNENLQIFFLFLFFLLVI